MAKFKEKLIKEMTKELSKNFWQWIDISRGNINEYLERYLRNKLSRNYVIIDREKLKSKLKVNEIETVFDGYSITKYKTGLYAAKIITPELKASVPNEIIEDNLKEMFIKALEECEIDG